MKSAHPDEAGASALEPRRHCSVIDRWQAAHALARRIPVLPERERFAAVSLLLARFLDLLRTVAS
jgi:hypothetical protein